MRRSFLIFLFLPVIAMATTSGVTTYKSAFNVATTLDRLSDLAASKGLKVFARIDFAHDARDAGLTLRDEQLLIFGNPKAGTLLLQAAPSAGLDLPLKALAYEDADGTTWIAFNEPTYIVVRHAIPSELEVNIRGAIALIRAAAGVPPAGAEKIP
jgi:uncharacterized protein (DUF302 family)